jgi:hypothetical protein
MNPVPRMLSWFQKKKGVLGCPHHMRYHTVLPMTLWNALEKRRMGGFAKFDSPVSLPTDTISKQISKTKSDTNKKGKRR